jgi:hypothetical protein
MSNYHVCTSECAQRHLTNIPLASSPPTTGQVTESTTSRRGVFYVQIRPNSEIECLTFEELQKLKNSIEGALVASMAKATPNAMGGDEK